MIKRRYFYKLAAIAAMVCCAQSAYAEFDSYDKMGDWEYNNTRGGINVSTFNYMDINRNGEYDSADKPMAGVINKLYQGDKQLRYVHTNSNGWGNFRLSKFEKNAVIKAPGRYRFEILPPPQWTITSKNAVQEFEVKEVYGSIGGLGALKMPVPIGLMPDLFITGQASAGKVGDVVTLTNTKVAGEVVTTKLDAKRRFTFTNLEPASYALSHTSAKMPVTVELASFPVHVGDVSAPRSQQKANQVASFDDISKSDLRKVPNGYKGLKWFNLNAMEDSMGSSNIGYINGTLSPKSTAYLSSGHPATISSSKPFAFQQGAFTIAWFEAQGETLHVEYYNGTEKLGEDAITLSVFGPIIYMPQRDGITEMRLRTEHYWQGILEDLHFSVGE